MGVETEEQMINLTKPPCKTCHCWPCVMKRAKEAHTLVEAVAKTYIENKFGPFQNG
jgi:hypothetical protein